MKLKSIIIIASILCILLCVSSVSATQDNATLSIDDSNIQLESDNDANILSENEIAAEDNITAGEINQTNTNTSNTTPNTTNNN